MEHQVIWTVYSSLKSPYELCGNCGRWSMPDLGSDSNFNQWACEPNPDRLEKKLQEMHNLSESVWTKIPASTASVCGWEITPLYGS